MTTFKHFRRNYLLGITNGALFGFIDSIVAPHLVLSIFVYHLGGSNFLVGLLPAIADGGWFLPQFLISHRLQRLPRKLPVYVAVAVVRFICWVLLTLATFALARGDPGVLLALFFLLYSAYCFAAGFAGTPFMDIVAKSIPGNRLGPFFGHRDLLGAITGIGAGYLVNYFLSPDFSFGFPINFAFLFAITTVAVLLGLGAFSFVVEPPETVERAVTTFREQLRAARIVLRQDDNYRRYLLARFVLAIAAIALPFYAIYATQVLRIPTETLGAYIALSTMSSLISNPICSRVSDERGNRILLVIGAVGMLALPVIAFGFGLLSAGASLAYPFGILFVALGVTRTAQAIAFPSFLLEIAPAPGRSLYVGFTNTILGIATFIPISGGILLDLFGFQALFILNFVVAAIALVLARGLKEPRARKD